MEFTFKKREMIVASPPSPAHVVTLSSLDQSVPPQFMSTLFFFPPPSTPPPSTESLTLSLASALAAFSPLAGRLKPRSNGAGMHVECHNQGALFVDAHTPATLKDLLSATGNGVYEPSPLWSSLVPDDDEEGDILAAGKPLLWVQLTRLACGGLVLGMVLHHQVVDGTAAMHFEASWAELARGQPITAHPHLDRTCMDARVSSPRPTVDHKAEFTIHSVPAVLQPVRLVLDATGSSPRNASRIFEFRPDERLVLDANDVNECSPPIASRIFEFSSEEVQSLRERANGDLGGEISTAFQALAAHIWKHVTLTRKLAASHPVNLGWPVNERDRFRPPLPAHYFGNAICLAFTEASAGEVTAQPVGVTADRIRRATRAVTDGRVPSSPLDLVITSWVGFEVYEMDWGWGSPCFFTPVILPSTAPTIGGGKVVLLPQPDRRAVSALIILPPPSMDALLLDTHFHPILLETLPAN